MTNICIHIPNTNFWFSTKAAAVEDAMTQLVEADAVERREHVDWCWQSMQLLPYISHLDGDQQQMLANSVVYVFAHALLYEEGEEWFAPAPNEFTFHESTRTKQ